MSTGPISSATPTTAFLTRANYTGFDFDTINDDLRSQLQANFAANYNDFTESALGIMLLDEVAYGLDGLSFYIDRRATDNYLVSARTRKSVARITRQLGYKMTSAVSASVDVNITVPTAFPFNIPLPAGFQLNGPNGLIFQTSQPLTIATGSPTATQPNLVPCYEGESFSETFVSDGTSNQVFTLRRVPANQFVVQGTVSVIVNGLPYTEFDFIDFESPQTQFEVGYNDSPPTVRFGDGTAGTIPPNAATIVVSYVAGSGSAGQVTSGTITSAVTPLVVNFTQIPLVISNPSGSIGGSDAESLEHAQVFAGQVWKTRMVAVTQEDYESLAGAYADPLFGRVSLAQAISVRSASQDLDLNNQLAAINNTVNYPNPYGGLTTGTILAPIPPAQVPPVQSEVDGIYVADAKQRLAQVIRDTSSSTGLTAQLTAIASSATLANSALATLLATTQTIQTQVSSGKTAATSATGGLSPVTSTILGFPVIGVSDTAVANNLTSQTAAYLIAQLSAFQSAVSSSTVAAAPGFSTVIHGGTGASVMTVTGTPTQDAFIGVTINNGGTVGITGITLTVSVNGVNTSATPLSLGVAQSMYFSGLNLTLKFTVANVVTGDTYCFYSNAGTTILAPTDQAQWLAYIGSVLNNPNYGINYISTSGASQLSSSDQSSLLLSLGNVSAQLATVLTNLSTALTGISTQIGNVTSVQQQLTGAGTPLTPGIGLSTSTSGTLVNAASLLTQDIVTQVGDTSSVPTAPFIVIQLDPTGVSGPLVVPGSIVTVTYPIVNTTPLTIMSDIEEVQASIQDQNAIIDGATQDLYNHVDAILAADCQSNLITVPILSTDSSGFYAPPSNGLINALENYLEARNEVTQTVQVVSGSESLVYAVIGVRVGYTQGYSKSVILSAVGQAVDSVLKGRSFGQSLYDSELWEAVDAIQGVSFTNISIYGNLASIYDATSVSNAISAAPLGSVPVWSPGSVVTTLLDPSGNLILNSGQVITKGVTVVLPPELVVG
jgi:hypothetical protein